MVNNELDIDELIDADRDGETLQSKSRHDLYETWRNMVRRCHNPNYPKYPSYGALGIKVCDKWREDFWAFVYDVGPRPDPSYSLDRIRVSGDYEPGNVQWATDKEQCRNKTNNVWLSAGGFTLLAADWAKKLGISRSTLYRKLKQGVQLETLWVTYCSQYSESGQ